MIKVMLALLTGAQMRKSAYTAFAIFFVGLLSLVSVFSAGNLAKQKPIIVRVELGSKQNELRFSPSDLTFETGKLYRLILTNPSKKKHYFTSPGLSAMVYTRKVQIVADGTTRAEIKGAIREIEVYPGGVAEWWFVPIATGKLTDLHCNIQDADGRTHAAKGMVGTIVIK